MVRVPRKEFLNRLLAVRPGATSQETFQQSDCVVLRKGRAYTYCQEIACSIESKLPLGMNGAVELPALIKLLEYLPEEEIELGMEERALFIKGKGRKARLSMPEDVLLPIGDVTLPAQSAWKPLDPAFIKAADLTYRCTVKKSEVFAQQCVHIHAEYMEACDNTKILRYRVPSFLDEETLVRGQSLKAMVPFGFTKAAQTGDWLHFRNPAGLRMSIRKFDLESYPAFDSLLSLRGEKVTFPKGLPEAAQGAGLFASEDGTVEIKVTKQRLYIEGRRPSGEYTEVRSLKYDGPDMQFAVPPKLIAEIIGMGNECELTERSIRVAGDGFIYCASVQ